MILLAVASLLCAVIPAVLFCVNLRLYREPPPAGSLPLSAISVLIPARNEEHGIAAAVQSVLQTNGVEFEVIVMDDASSDRTAAIVEAIAAADPRVRLQQAPALPAGWNGKQHACWALAHAARFPVLCFVDADVRLAPEALPRMAAFMLSQKAALVSGFPRQITETTLEWLLLPLIHFVLLGFLPLSRMRKTTDPAFAAGCGQFLMVDRQAYFAAGGHAAIRATMHDGLLLPRLLRASGHRTDLADLTNLATCRMYTNARQVWFGLAKNAIEGIAAPARIVPITLILLLGQVLSFAYLLCVFGVLIFRLPFILFAWHHRMFIFDITHSGTVTLISILAALVAAWLPRVLAVRRFRQDWRSALLHPVGILILLSIQWYALLAKSTGRAVEWKKRSYATE